MVTYADIKDFRAEISEVEELQVRISPYITLDQTPLEGIPDIKLAFIVGGGVFMTFDYQVMGGPDDGKRVTLVPWRSRRACLGVASYYNGPPEKAESTYGYSARPALHYHSTLHLATIMYIRGLLKADQRELMARELESLYDCLG